MIRTPRPFVSRIPWQAYLGLCKLRVVGAIVFTAVIGMFMSTEALPPLATVLWGSLGIGLAASSAAALNHVFDREIDRKMGRTEDRPLPKSQLFCVCLSHAIVFKGTTCLPESL